MSTGSDRKGSRVGGDWETALEEWDQAPLKPSLASDSPTVPSTRLAAQRLSRAEAIIRLRQTSASPASSKSSASSSSSSPSSSSSSTSTGTDADSLRAGVEEDYVEGLLFDFPEEHETDEYWPEEHGSDELREGAELRRAAAAELTRETIPHAPASRQAARSRRGLQDEGSVSGPPHSGQARETVASGQTTQSQNKSSEVRSSSAGPQREPSQQMRGGASGDGTRQGTKQANMQSNSPAGRQRSIQANAQGNGREGSGVMNSDLGNDCDGPRSIMPAPVGPFAARWTDERDAMVHLDERGLRAEWESRASWFAEEAAARQDDKQRARIMLAVSEMFAMMGDDDKGVSVAVAACQCDNEHPLLQRQARYSAVRDRRWGDVLEGLGVEAQTAPTPDAKVHALLMSATLAERLMVDASAIDAQLEEAASVLPLDPRPYVAKMVRHLNAESGETVEPQWPEDPSLAPLADGAAVVASVRRAQEGPVQIGGAVGVFEALPRARAALRAENTEAAVHALRSLRGVHGMGGGASWLAAALAGQHAASRASAVELLNGLASGAHGAVALRMCALRAVESRDSEALNAVLSKPSASAFSAADRVVLAALFSENVESVEPYLAHLLARQDHAVLGSAMRWSLSPVGRFAERVEACSLGSGRYRASCAVARAAAGGAGTQEFWERVAALRDCQPGEWVDRLLEIEMAIALGISDPLVDLLATWTGSGEQFEERDRALAAGLVAEMLEDHERMAREYMRAVELDPSHEGAIRALRVVHPTAYVQGLMDLVLQSDGSKGAILALDAAMVRGSAEAEYFDLLRQSHQKDPSLPIASVLGERAARARGDVDGMLEWV
ncbi:MAG: hypothetical protein FWD57_06480, partial [Polyangiaceae bacterium]|nr:hypothetical protein [Polyangiaceae bacterium]